MLPDDPAPCTWNYHWITDMASFCFCERCIKHCSNSTWTTTSIQTRDRFVRRCLDGLCWYHFAINHHASVYIVEIERFNHSKSNHCNLLQRFESAMNFNISQTNDPKWAFIAHTNTHSRARAFIRISSYTQNFNIRLLSRILFMCIQHHILYNSYILHYRSLTLLPFSNSREKIKNVCWMCVCWRRNGKC